MSERKPTCTHRIFSGARWDYDGHLCDRPAKYERDGKPVCGTHTAEAIAKRQARSDARVEKYIADSREAYAQESDVRRKAADYPRLESELKSLRTQLQAAQERAEAAESSWRCFHCNHVFVDQDLAREHFGNGNGMPRCAEDWASGRFGGAHDPRVKWLDEYRNRAEVAEERAEAAERELAAIRAGLFQYRLGLHDDDLAALDHDLKLHGSALASTAQGDAGQEGTR